MKDINLKIDPEEEKRRITAFLKKTFAEQHIDKAVIGMSGGIDSTVSFFLLKEVLPPENIIVAHMFYESPIFTQVKKILEDAKIPNENIHLLSIKTPVDATTNLLQIENDNMRRGNIAARTRMIILFDLAKNYNALVCGTENKSENLLGYFTRFGDQASDIEPIEHLYKTQVLELARHLGIPEEIITQNPSAGLWAGQTDEGEFGFSYEEADQVLSLFVDEKQSLEKIEAKGFTNAAKILSWREKNLFKHNTPYIVNR